MERRPRALFKAFHSERPLSDVSVLDLTRKLKMFRHVDDSLGVINCIACWLLTIDLKDRTIANSSLFNLSLQMQRYCRILTAINHLGDQLILSSTCVT